jgi:flagellar hook-associated protein 2
MAVDYLSTLNSKGSGINITQLVDSLVAAEVDPQKNLVTSKIEKGTVAISEMAKMRSELATLSASLDAPNAGLAILANSNSNAVQLSVDDPDSFAPFSSKVTVNRLASQQALEFTTLSSASITSKTQPINGGAAENFTLSFGTWSGSGFAANGITSDISLAMEAGDTVSDLVDALTALEGVTANLVYKGDGSYSIAVISDTGEENSIRITSDSGDFTTLAGVNGLPSQQVIAAVDAELVVDGITITRSSNEIADLFNGTTVTISAVTAAPVTVSVTEDSEIAFEEMNALIDYINANRTMLNAATKRSVNGAEPGPFAGDITLNSIKTRLSSITTNPIYGFSADPIYLSDLGVRTELDGSLSLNEDDFKTAFAEDSSKYRSVFRSNISTGSSDITASKASYANLTPGVYQANYDANNNTMTVDGVTFLTSAAAAQPTRYYSVSGAFEGLSLIAAPGTAQSTTVFVGQSLIDTVRGYLDELLSSSGDFTSRENTLESDNAEYELKIATFDEKAVGIRSRYMESFASMEQMVTKFKSTGEYLTTMMDAWSNNK